MQINLENRDIIIINYFQEHLDEDYASCLWARFYIDSMTYTLGIASDCGNYMYCWQPTPEAESFINLLTRLHEDYLLEKLSDRTVVNAQKTFENIKEYLDDILEDGERDFDYEDIRDVCNYDSPEEVLAAVIDCLKYTNAYTASFDEYDIWQSIETDYPYNAKKICSIFKAYVQPILISKFS